MTSTDPIPFAAFLFLLGPWPGHGMFAADWPRLGGPGGSGVSPETGLARAWPEEGPKANWTVEVGEGFAGAAVHDRRVFLLDRESNRRDVLRCFGLGDGRELWRSPCEAPGELPFNGSRNVPTVDAKRVYAVGPLGHFYCMERETGTVLWSKHPGLGYLRRPETERGVPKNLSIPERTKRDGPSCERPPISRTWSASEGAEHP